MKKMAKIFAVALAVLIALSCIPMATIGAFALETDATYAVLNDASDASKFTAYELMGAGQGTGVGHTPTGNYYKAQIWTPPTWSTWSGVYMDVDAGSLVGAAAVAVWVDFTEMQPGGNQFSVSVGVVDKTLDADANGKVNYKDVNAQMTVANNAVMPTAESRDAYFLSADGTFTAKTIGFDAKSGTNLGNDFGGFKGWYIVPVVNTEADLSATNLVKLSRNGHVAVNGADAAKTFYFGSTAAVYDIEGFVAEQQAAFAAETVVLNDGTNNTGATGTPAQTPALVTIPGVGTDGTAIRLKHTGAFATDKHWWDWAKISIPYAIPEGADVSGATAVAVWVDFTNLVGNEYWKMNNITSSADDTVKSYERAQNEMVTLIAADGTVKQANTGVNGYLFAGFKGWYIVNLPEGADLTTTDRINFSRSGYSTVDAANVQKSVYFDSVTAIEDLNAFVVEQSAKLANQANAKLDYTLLNDFSDPSTVTSTYSSSGASVIGSIDGAGYKFNTTRGKNMIFSIPETDLSEYQAIAFHISNPNAIKWSFNDFQNAAGTKITQSTKVPATSKYYLLNDNGTMNYAEIATTEAGFWNIYENTSAYLIVKFKDGLAEGDLLTDAIKFMGTQWHNSSAANSGYPMYIDNLIAIKDVDAFVRAFELDKVGTKAAATAGEPTLTLTDDVAKSNYDITVEPVAGAASYVLDVYTAEGKETFTTTEPTYNLTVDTTKEYMIQIKALNAYGAVVGVYKDINITALSDSILIPINDFSDADSFTHTLDGVGNPSSTIKQGDDIGGKTAIMSTWGWSGMKVNNLIGKGPLTGVQGLLLYIDASNFVGQNTFRIQGATVDPDTGAITASTFVGVTAKDTWVNIIDAETGVVTRGNHWNDNGFPVAAGSKAYYLIEIGARFPDAEFDFAAFDYLTIGRSGYIAMSEEDIGKDFYIDSLTYVTDKAAFLANPLAYIDTFTATAGFDKADTLRPDLVIAEDGTLTVTPGEISVLPEVEEPAEGEEAVEPTPVVADKVVVSLFDQYANEVSTKEVVDGSVDFYGLVVGDSYAVQVLGYAADELIYVGKPVSFTAAVGCQHKWEFTSTTVEPDCDTEGEAIYTCAMCGETETRVVSATGHTYTAVVTDPTCTAGGYTTYTCDCGDSYTDDFTDPTGEHVYDEGVVTTPATCGTAGVKTYTCTYGCGDSYTEEIPATGAHTYVDTVVPATPDAQGYTDHTCSVCGDNYKDNYVDYVPEDVTTPVEYFEYTIVDDATVTITKYIGSDTVVIIPAEIEGKPVTIIGQRAFYSNRNITKVTIPGSVTTLSKESFRGCTSLTEVELNEGLQIISTSAFVATKLVKVECPSTLTTIGVSAFNGVTTLTDVKLANVQTIKGTAFAGCTALGSGNATKYIAIPETLTELGAGAFQNCTTIARVDWYAVALSSGAAGNNESPAFMGCTGIKTVNVMNTAERLPSFMFYKAANPSARAGITALTFKSTSKVTSIGDRAFYQARMGRITLPATMKSIGKEAFRNINLLTQLDLGTGLEKIGQSAFSNCNNLATVTIPGNVKTVLAYAFRDCAALETAVFEEGVEAISSYVFKGTALKSLTLANSITLINAGICHLCEDATIYYYEGSYAEGYLNSSKAKLTGQTLSSLGVYAPAE